MIILGCGYAQSPQKKFKNDMALNLHHPYILCNLLTTTSVLFYMSTQLGCNLFVDTICYCYAEECHCYWKNVDVDHVVLFNAL